MSESIVDSRAELLPLGALLPRVGAAVTRWLGRVVSDHGLTPTSLRVLEALGHEDELSHRELAGRLGLAPATLTPVVDALEASGWLRRARDPGDRRVVRLSITATGRDRLRTASAEVTAATRRSFPEPAPEHAEVVRGYLLEVLAAVTED